ncbi:histidine phosphatase family protein [Myxococcota bacterium]|nr:histidine phosphatase family protein [Myxococcota bacterium]
MSELWILRHGETEWNVEGRLQGSSDSPLTARGRAQSEAAARATQHVAFTCIYTSDLGRAQHTARLVRGERALEIHTDPRLRELRYGHVEGMTWPEIAARHPGLREELRRQDFAPPGGETRAELQARVAAAMHDIARRHVGARVLVVTHGGALSTFLRFVLGVPLEAPPGFRADNCALSRFDLEGDRFRLVTWGVADHLHGV